MQMTPDSCSTSYRLAAGAQKWLTINGKKTKSMGNAVFRNLSARKPFDGFSKKFVQLIATSTPPHVQMLGSISSKGACLRMREVVAARRLFLITF